MEITQQQYSDSYSAKSTHTSALKCLNTGEDTLQGDSLQVGGIYWQSTARFSCSFTRPTTKTKSRCFIDVALSVARLTTPYHLQHTKYACKQTKIYFYIQCYSPKFISMVHCLHPCAIARCLLHPCLCWHISRHLKHGTCVQVRMHVQTKNGTKRNIHPSLVRGTTTSKLTTINVDFIYI